MVIMFILNDSEPLFMDLNICHLHIFAKVKTFGPLSNWVTCFLLTLYISQHFPGGSVMKNPPAVQELQVTWVQSLGGEDSLEEGMATHSSILPWRIPMDRGAWWVKVHSVAKSQTQLKWLKTHIQIHTYHIYVFIYDLWIFSPSL